MMLEPETDTGALVAVLEGFKLHHHFAAQNVDRVLKRGGQVLDCEGDVIDSGDSWPFSAFLAGLVELHKAWRRRQVAVACREIAARCIALLFLGKETAEGLTVALRSPSQASNRECSVPGTCQIGR